MALELTMTKRFGAETIRSGLSKHSEVGEPINVSRQNARFDESIHKAKRDRFLMS